jgi:tetratricopeptide (TPR) repeat protein
MTYEKKGDLAAALADYSQAIKLDPQDQWASPAYYYSRAGAFRAQAKHAEALTDCTAILALVPDDPRGFYCRGLSEAALGQMDQARADFKQAITLTPAGAWSAWVTEAAQAELNQIGP